MHCLKFILKFDDGICKPKGSVLVGPTNSSMCDKCRLQTCQLAGKRGKHCSKMLQSTKWFGLRKVNLVEHFTTMFTLLTCKSAVCICRKVILRQNCLTSQGEQRANFLTFSLNFREGHVAVAEKLILHGADVELPDNYGQSPLFMACWKGRI